MIVSQYTLISQISKLSNIFFFPKLLQNKNKAKPRIKLYAFIIWQNKKKLNILESVLKELEVVFTNRQF